MNISSLYLESKMKAAEAMLTALCVILLAANLVAAPIFLRWWTLLLYAVEMIPPIAYGVWGKEFSVAFKLGATVGGIISTPVWLCILLSNFLFKDTSK